MTWRVGKFCLHDRGSSLFGAHRCQLMTYVDQYLLLRDISVVATMIYPSQPTHTELTHQVADYMGAWGIQVMWYYDQDL